MSTPSAAPPAWLEAAAKLDALLGDKVPIAGSRTALPPTDNEPEEGEAPLAEATRLPERKPAATKLPVAKARPRITVAPMPVTESTEEVDIAWLGYSPAGLLPSTLGLSIASAVVVFAIRPFLPDWIMYEAVDAPLAAVWMLQLIRAAYRLMAYNYRLTTRRLFRERGRLYPPEAPTALATVARVEVVQTWVDRWAGVGMVRIVPEDASPSVPAIDLAGVRRPGLLAARIEEAVKAAREGNVIATKKELATDERG